MGGARVTSGNAVGLRHRMTSGGGLHVPWYRLNAVRVVPNGSFNQQILRHQCGDDGFAATGKASNVEIIVGNQEMIVGPPGIFGAKW